MYYIVRSKSTRILSLGALRLYRERSDYLFELRGIVLGHNRTHLLYKAILSDVFLSSRTISDYNDFLRVNGVGEEELL